jgi:HD-GYP domain-containing protein (c-di-GMP phosphodiesterase class II)
VRNHHESWDGRGYPDGLVGEEIPLLARIIKVADCFDALVSERPYGAVLSEEEALAHFRLQAGSMYDPKVVEALFEVLRDETSYRACPTDARDQVEDAVAAAS